MQEMPDTRDTERLRATIDAVHAPPELHARVAEQLGGARRRRRTRLRLAFSGALAAAAAAVVVLAIVLPGGGGGGGGRGGGGGPTVLEVARLSGAPPTQPAPAVDRGSPRWLDARVGGVWFPSWREMRGWRATGSRRDTVDGRRAMTVYYAGPTGVRLTYTIVDGAPLPWPEPSHAAQRGDTVFRVVRQRGRTVVTWREGGHQCVIAAPSTVREDRLIALAAWAA